VRGTDWRLEQLVLAGLALTSEANLERVMRRVAEVAADVLGARYTAIGVLAPDGRTLEDFVTHGMTEAERAHIGILPVGRGVLGTVIREARPIRMADIAGHPDAVGFPAHHPPMRSFLGVPISGLRGPIGNLYATDKIGSAEFTSEDEHIAVLLAAMTASAVENARLHEESGRLLAEVHQLHRHRERFFAMVNHELRNALAAVLGWSELLVRRKDPATVPPAALEVLESAEQAVALISDLLDLSRLDEDRLQPVVRPVDAGSLAGRAASRVRPAARAKGIRISLANEQVLPVIETDASRVEQILVNLLSNAIKYTPEQSRILVTTTATDGTVRWLVEDEGPGIRPEQAELIFDVYVTAAEGEKQGIGLGLPLSRRLARLLGGDLCAIPEDGAGRFELTLPVLRS
jgi:signal transduction histidine kinase